MRVAIPIVSLDRLNATGGPHAGGLIDGRAHAGGLLGRGGRFRARWDGTWGGTWD